MKGIVKWFDTKKGYGFITLSDGSKDVFVHHTGIAGNGYKKLDEGQNVEFEMEKSDKGMKAVKVQVIS